MARSHIMSDTEKNCGIWKALRLCLTPDPKLEFHVSTTCPKKKLKASGIRLFPKDRIRNRGQDYLWLDYYSSATLLLSLLAQLGRVCLFEAVPRSADRGAHRPSRSEFHFYVSIKGWRELSDEPSLGLRLIRYHDKDSIAAARVAARENRACHSGTKEKCTPTVLTQHLGTGYRSRPFLAAAGNAL